MNIIIANRLIKLRKEKGLSQEELADKLGISRQAVSKWERAEASPDTDNLICLAKLYGVSLDELLQDEDDIETIVKEQVKDNEKDNDKGNDDSKDKSNNDHDRKFQFWPNGLHIETDEGEKVHIDKNGIHVHDGDDDVHIGFKGIHIHSGSQKKDEEKNLNETGDENEDIDARNTNSNQCHCDCHCDCQEYSFNPKSNNKYLISYACVNGVFMLCAIIAMVLIGNYVQKGWSWSWTFILLTPVIGSIFKCIKKKKIIYFSYSLLVTFVYCFICLAITPIWHPLWVVFLTIPIFYSIAKAINKR